MPAPSWEEATNANFYGYLKFLDFQSDGFDVHATFEKSNKIHLSVYVVKTKADTKASMKYLIFGVSGVSLPWASQILVKNVVRPSSAMPADFWANFNDWCTKKAIELGILDPQQKPASPTTGVLSAVVPKGGSSGIPAGATWGDKHRQTVFNEAFPAMTGKNT